MSSPEQDTLISAENHFAVMAALFVIAAIGFLAEKTRIGAVLTGLTCGKALAWTSVISV